MKIKEICNILENIAPLSLQENYDNSGLIVGNSNDEITGILISLDVTEEIVSEAIEKKSNLIIAHHPIIFGSLKSLNGKNYVERTIIKAIKNDISIYISHTNLDKVLVNKKICEKLNLKNCHFLQNRKNELKKLITYVPINYVSKVRDSIFKAGAGHIGNYDSCSFNVMGEGTFRALENSNPFVGNLKEFHKEKEVKIETVFPKFNMKKVISALIKSHPYEEVAYDIYNLENSYKKAGDGIIGELENPLEEKVFLHNLKEIFDLKIIKHTKMLNKKIKKVAFCGGSGIFLLKNAINKNADIFITGDIKYHQFFEAENKLILADIGHYESEKHIKEIFYEIFNKNFFNFAIHLSKVNTNPVFIF